MLIASFSICLHSPRAEARIPGDPPRGSALRGADATIRDVLHSREAIRPVAPYRSLANLGRVKSGVGYRTDLVAAEFLCRAALDALNSQPASSGARGYLPPELAPPPGRSEPSRAELSAFLPEGAVAGGGGLADLSTGTPRLARAPARAVAGIEINLMPDEPQPFAEAAVPFDDSLGFRNLEGAAAERWTETAVVPEAPDERMRTAALPWPLMLAFLAATAGGGGLCYLLRRLTRPPSIGQRGYSPRLRRGVASLPSRSLTETLISETA